MQHPVQEHQAAPATDADVIVVGAGMAGLTVAHDLSKRGYRVLVLEEAERVGGLVTSLRLAGLELDAGAESFATRGGAVAELAAELGLADDIVDPERAGAWLRLADRSVRLPRASMLGIPSVPLARDVIAAIGLRGALRAWLDRVLPVMTIGKERALGRLVEARMGRAVLERLVAPISAGVYSSDARSLDVALVAPGLNEALTRAGSLSGAVAPLLTDGSRPGSAVQGIRGGMHRLPVALAAAAVDRGAEIRTGVRVDAVCTTEQGWAVRVAPPTASVSEEAGAAEATALTASALVVATGAGHATALLAEVLGIDAAEPAPATGVELVTLVLDRLEGAPAGSGALVAEDAGIAAKALTHATAKWAWLAEAAGDRSVVRLSYGRAGQPAATAELDDAAAIALARSDASTILGTDVPEPVAAARVRWQQAQPSSAIGARERQQRVRERVAEHATLEVVGAWIAGTGLAQVVPDARRAAVRIRRQTFAGGGSIDRPHDDDEPHDDGHERMDR